MRKNTKFTIKKMKKKKWQEFWERVKTGEIGK